MTYGDLIKAYLVPMAPRPTGMSPGGRLIEKVECILFDIYGTLFISGAGDISMATKTAPLLSKLKHLAAKYKIGASPRLLIDKLHHAIEIQHRKLKRNGIDFPEIEIDKIWLDILDWDDIHQVREFAVEYELITNPVFPMPNLSKLMAACRKHKYSMGLVSNAQFFTPHLFEWFLDAEPTSLGFKSDLIFLSYQMGYAKPSQIFFESVSTAVQGSGMDPHSVLVVGNDLLNDIYPAKQMGFQTALFAGDARSLRLRTEDPRCRNLAADLVLTDLGQLIDHIS